MLTEAIAERQKRLDQVLTDFALLIEPLVEARNQLDFNAWRLGLGAMLHAETVRREQAKKPAAYALRSRTDDAPTFRKAKEGKIDWQQPGSRFVNPKPSPKRFGVTA